MTGTGALLGEHRLGRPFVGRWASSPAPRQNHGTRAFAGVPPMDLTGHHSNPSGPLEALLRGPPSTGDSPVAAVANGQITRPGQAARAIASRHLRQGRIIDAMGQRVRAVNFLAYKGHRPTAGGLCHSHRARRERRVSRMAEAAARLLLVSCSLCRSVGRFGLSAAATPNVPSW